MSQKPEAPKQNVPNGYALVESEIYPGGVLVPVERLDPKPAVPEPVKTVKEKSDAEPA